MKGLITDLPMYLQEALEARGVTQESYNTLKLETVLDIYLINEGIIGYAEKILSTINLLNLLNESHTCIYCEKDRLTKTCCGVVADSFGCTREKGHKGMHVACGASKHKLHCW